MTDELDGCIRFYDDTETKMYTTNYIMHRRWKDDGTSPGLTKNYFCIFSNFHYCFLRKQKYQICNLLKDVMQFSECLFGLRMKMAVDIKQYVDIELLSTGPTHNSHNKNSHTYRVREGYRTFLISDQFGNGL